VDEIYDLYKNKKIKESVLINKIPEKRALI
jgi:hypothetical protein